MFSPKFSKKFLKEYAKLCRSNPDKVRKIYQLVADILAHPQTGIGRPERLKYMGENGYSREIDRKNRLVYRIMGDDVIRFESCEGHYGDH